MKSISKSSTPYVGEPLKLLGMLFLIFGALKAELISSLLVLNMC